MNLQTSDGGEELYDGSVPTDGDFLFADTCRLLRTAQGHDHAGESGAGLGHCRAHRYPAIILSGALADGQRVGGSELLSALGATIALLVLLFVAAWVLPRLLRYDRSQNGIINTMTIFSNIGFMGVPMIDAIYGKGALIYMTIFLIPFNLLFFSYAIQTIKGSGTGQKLRLSDLLNEGMIACFLAIIVYIADIRVPYVISQTVAMLGSMTAPLAMILTGAFLSGMDFRGMFTDVRIWVFTVIKMVVLPVVIVLVLGQFFENRILLAVCLAAIATPVGNVLALLTSIYNEEAYPTSIKGITLTTIVSIATMPLVFYLTGLD